MPVVKRYATYEDLEEAPDTMVAELIEGDLIVSPRPASPHARSATVLGSDLLGRFDGPPGGAGRPGGWWFLFEPELHFGRNVLVPDVAAWRRESMAVLPNTAAFTLAVITLSSTYSCAVSLFVAAIGACAGPLAFFASLTQSFLASPLLSSQRSLATL